MYFRDSGLFEASVFAVNGITSPEPTPEKSQCDLRKPQAQSFLPRILDPMPFPKGLLETLAHTAAFVDQAGYLAKYAQEVKAKDSEITNLKKRTVENITGDRSAAKAKVEELKKQPDKANQETKSLRNEIAKLREFIKKDKIQDDEARKTLEDTQNKLKTVSEVKGTLQKELDAANVTIGELNTRISEYQQQIIQRDTDISRLKAETHG
ncbi:hypothetical protein NW768_009779 [Fusarium equiseti]|uniref:Uncharacterized protein n=1 Tax=Fusarium equiseti TaxID=61235 RepID=A0ABQ8R2A5_FUSEQ|nr:hypothetical protein NW768_009779 [Fusarium equiseti]